MNTAADVISKILQHGQAHCNDSAIEIPANLAWAPQGVINIFRLPRLPDDVIEVNSNGQLAPGTSRGSRHCIKHEDMKHCKFYQLANPTPLHGPIIVFSQPITITHPEHGDQTWLPGTVAITYQRRHADEVRRIQD